jgi:hypothetical protein
MSVPGEGRATVYAIISEVDEWLASTKITEVDPGTDDLEDSFSATVDFPAFEIPASSPVLHATIETPNPPLLPMRQTDSSDSVDSASFPTTTRLPEPSPLRALPHSSSPWFGR